MTSPSFHKEAREIAYKIKEEAITSKLDGFFVLSIERGISLALQSVYNRALDEAAKVAKEHGNDHSKQADKLEAKSVSEFTSEATKSNIVAEMDSLAMEGWCIEKAILQLKQESL